MKLTIALVCCAVLAGCAGAPGTLESGTPIYVPEQWQIYCAEHPAREECK